MKWAPHACALQRSNQAAGRTASELERKRERAIERTASQLAAAGARARWRGQFRVGERPVSGKFDRLRATANLHRGRAPSPEINDTLDSEAVAVFGLARVARLARAFKRCAAPFSLFLF